MPGHFIYGKYGIMWEILAQYCSKGRVKRKDQIMSVRRISVFLLCAALVISLTGCKGADTGRVFICRNVLGRNTADR